MSNAARPKLRKFLQNCRFFLDGVLEHARTRSNLSHSELEAMFRRASSIQTVMESTRKNPELHIHLESIFTQSEFADLKDPLKSLYLTLLSNLRLKNTALSSSQMIYSKHSGKGEIPVLEENLNVLRPLLVALLRSTQRGRIKGSLLTTGVISLRGVEAKMFDEPGAFLALLHALATSEDPTFSKGFLSLPLTHREQENVFDMIKENAGIFAQAAEKHDSLLLFLVKLVDSCIERGEAKVDAASLLADVFAASSLKGAETLIEYMEKFKVEVQNETYSILIEKYNYY